MVENLKDVKTEIGFCDIYAEASSPLSALKKKLTPGEL